MEPFICLLFGWLKERRNCYSRASQELEKIPDAAVEERRKRGRKYRGKKGEEKVRTDTTAK